MYKKRKGDKMKQTIKINRKQHLQPINRFWLMDNDNIMETTETKKQITERLTQEGYIKGFEWNFI